MKEQAFPSPIFFLSSLISFHILPPPQVNTIHHCTFYRQLMLLCDKSWDWSSDAAVGWRVRLGILMGKEE